MAITYVGAASAASTSVSLPTFQAGDLAFVLALRSSSATAPTVPSGWTTLSTATDTYGGAAGYRVLQGGDTSTGTWTNAEYIGVAVYRGVHTILPWSSSGGPPTVTILSSSAFGPASASCASTTDRPLGIGIAATATVSSASSGTLQNGSGTRLAVVDGSTSTSTVGWSLSGTSVEAHITFGLRAASDFPIVADQDTTSGTQTSNSSSWTLSYPTNIAAGDLLLAFVAQDGGTGSPVNGTWPSGWVSGGSTSGANALQYAKKSATGSETGTFTWNPQGGASEQGAWMIVRIPAGTWEGTLETAFGNASSAGSVVVASSSGSSANPDPPVLNPANWDAENTLWFAVSASDTSRTYSAYPTTPATFTNTGYLASGGSTGATLAWARLEWPKSISNSTASTYVNYGETSNQRQVGQSFIATGDTLTKVDVWIRKVGSPTDDTIIELQTDSGSAPSGTVVATLGTYAGTSLTTSGELKTWSGSQSVTGGSKYWIVARRSGSLSNTNKYAIDLSSDSYAGGTYALYNGSTWPDSGSDIRFNVTLTASSVDPGTFTHSASDDWAAATIAVRPYTAPVTDHLAGIRYGSMSQAVHRGTY